MLLALAGAAPANWMSADMEQLVGDKRCGRGEPFDIARVRRWLSAAFRAHSNCASRPPHDAALPPEQKRQDRADGRRTRRRLTAPAGTLRPGAGARAAAGPCADPRRRTAQADALMHLRKQRHAERTSAEVEWERV